MSLPSRPPPEQPSEGCAPRLAELRELATVGLAAQAQVNDGATRGRLVPPRIPPRAPFRVAPRADFRPSPPASRRLRLMLLLAVGSGCAGCQGEPQTTAPQSALFDRGPPGNTPRARPERSLVRMTVEAQGETTVLVLEKRGWWIQAPWPGPADPLAVDALETALFKERMREVLDPDPNPQRLAELGLAPPRFKVTASTEGGQEVVLEGGRESPFDGSVPLRRSGDRAIYAVSGSARGALERGSEALRQRHVLPFSRNVISELSLRARDGTAWTLVKGEKERWSQTVAPGFEADRRVVERLLHRLKNLRAQEFARDTPQERASRGLDAPLLELTVVVQQRSIRLQFAAPVTDADTTVWARWMEAESSLLVRLERRALELLQLQPAAFRSRAVWSFDTNEVDRITLTPADGSPTFELARKPGAESPAWSLSGPREGPVDRFRIASLLWGFTSLRSAPDAPAAAAAPPSTRGLREIRILDREDRLLGHLRVFGPDPEAPGLWQVDTGAGPRILVAAEQLDALPAAPESLLGPATAADGG